MIIKSAHILSETFFILTRHAFFKPLALKLCAIGKFRFIKRDGGVQFDGVIVIVAECWSDVFCLP
jgi:hypothetical protein